MSVLRRLTKLLVKPAADPAVAAIYRVCIQHARQTALFDRLAVPDTIDGRFDMLLLHVLLVMRRLTDHLEVRQALFDLMFADMDVSLREMGVGDMGIGRRIKPMIQAFYGRGQAYEIALSGTDSELGEALHRNLYGNIPVTADAIRGMVEYVRKTVAHLERQSGTSLAQGNVDLVTLS